MTDRFFIRKKFRFEAAHQLCAAYSKACSECIHGHSYVVEVVFSSYDLQSDGMVVDFGLVKDLIKARVDLWDHALIMPTTFPHEYLDTLCRFNTKLILVAWNPTAENMARFLYYQIIKDCGERLPPNVLVHSVTVHETETGYATYSVEE